MTKKNLLSLLIEESKSYMGLDKIESLIEAGSGLENIPVQPLYMTIRNLPVEAKTALLPKLSAEQRTAFLDIDLWSKDELNVEDFSQWLYVYAGASDELKYEFIKSPEFVLFLKARFNIWTFDVEDPQYPDHDYYFLTEDNQLLFEYDEDCEIIDQIKDAIKHLYTEEGVENAYTFLFKIIADQIGMMTEDEYRLKKSRLQDFGFMDYFDALELTTAFPTHKHIDNFIKKTIASNRPQASVGEELQLQKPAYGLINVFEQVDDLINHELEKISNEIRLEFLNFNFIKLVNANLEVNGGIKKSTIEINRCSKETKTLLELGISYLTHFIDNEYSESINSFDIFSFTEVFKIGKSLIAQGHKKIKSTFLKLELDETFDTFLGPYFDQFISNSLSKNYEFTNFEYKKMTLNKYGNYLHWLEIINSLCELLPFAKAFFEKLEELKNKNLVQDHYYLNYNVSEIDFPALLTSSFSNFYLNDSLDQFKIGLTLKEFKQFLTSYQNKRNLHNWEQQVENFIQNFGFDKISDFKTILYYFLDDALSGYDEINNLSDDEFKYIGGPIILVG